ncbi:hypothetical protein NI26_02245 [Curtobacterium sp. MR_MD2014]|nr:hypothetical protein NI26_02245 [Curtobacterium sp. MR_MD2014]
MTSPCREAEDDIVPEIQSVVCPAGVAGTSKATFEPVLAENEPSPTTVSVPAVLMVAVPPFRVVSAAASSFTRSLSWILR